ncbi:nicotinate phosphoribosyltransferase [Modicisalibacter ilicicola DSM 19980]|uniref:Nicotinate phosphoribosyltransferase n=1 Tax=Modicisalibacter ilicicola DSM 19980 TaxID=1121942 RepID=A0A1M5E4E4_9GAMM|nr:nicotinate phosphoribosyltransferase [Halomonas ilicicola]SHF74065.1 nicotinate phosphoribosyltransferase [Halomonas ilicicola DSM 19980]
MPQEALVQEEDLGLLVDLYELTMIQAYWAEGMNERATFSLFFRSLPQGRNYMLACGQQHVARLVTQLRFGERQIDKLRSLNLFEEGFLEWLAGFRFSGDIHAVQEGTPVFPQEPLLEVEAPIAEAQLLESLVMNYVHLETVLASKASRLVNAAQGRGVVDFGMRRMHGIDAAVRGVRAYHVAGLTGTSNVLGSVTHGLSAQGTMAHSYVQAHGKEDDALLAFARHYPGTTLLVDTYDTVAAVKRLIERMAEDSSLDIGAIRLDSGDLEYLAKTCRHLLDEAGHQDIKIIASGGLNEHSIRELVVNEAPIDGFGVGTSLGASSDSPCLELAYKLTEYAGEPRLKHSPGKHSLPGRKQIYREQEADGSYRCDHLTLRDEQAPGTALLQPIVLQGDFQEAAMASPDAAREASLDSVSRLPPELRSLVETRTYHVTISDRLHACRRLAESRLGLPPDD